MFWYKSYEKRNKTSAIWSSGPGIGRSSCSDLNWYLMLSKSRQTVGLSEFSMHMVDKWSEGEAAASFHCLCCRLHCRAPREQGWHTQTYTGNVYTHWVMSQKLILDLGWPPTKFSPLSFISVDSLVLDAGVGLDGRGATDSEQSRTPPTQKKLLINVPLKAPCGFCLAWQFHRKKKNQQKYWKNSWKLP